MSANNNICKEHSGCLADIGHLKQENDDQWEAIKNMKDKQDAIFTRINIILGGIVVACIMMMINLVAN